MPSDEFLNLQLFLFDNVTSSEDQHGYRTLPDAEPEKDLMAAGWFGKLVLGLLLSLFIVVAVAGNLLVIVAVLTDRSLRHTGNYFIVSLALADTLVAVAVMTFAVANDVMGHWAFGRRVCRIWLSADVMCSTASILNLCAISADRYLHVRSPLHYDRLVTHRRCLVAIGLVWMMSALISFLPIHLDWHRVTAAAADDFRRQHQSQQQLVPLTEVDADLIYGQFSASSAASVLSNVSNDTSMQRRIAGSGVGDVINDGEDNDDESVCTLELNPLYAVLSSAISFYLPCMAMLFIYYRLHRYARRQVESIKMTYKYSPNNHNRHHQATANVPALTVTASPVNSLPSRSAAATAGVSSEERSTGGGDQAALAGNAGGSSSVSNPLRYKMSDHKAAITLGIIMGVFLLCWGPFFTVNLADALFGPRFVPPLVFAVFTWLGYVNSTMNPIIYSIFNRQFRDAFRRVLSLIRQHLVDSCCYCCCRHHRESSVFDHNNVDHDDDGSMLSCCRRTGLSSRFATTSGDSRGWQCFSCLCHLCRCRCCCCCCADAEAGRGGGAKYGAVLMIQGSPPAAPATAVCNAEIASNPSTGFIASAGTAAAAAYLTTASHCPRSGTQTRLSSISPSIALTQKTTSL